MGRVGWCIAFVFVWGLGLHAEERSPGEESALPGLQLDALSATRDRPLFAPDRRKAAPPSAVLPQNSSVEASEQAHKPQLILTGIIVSSSQVTVLLQDAGTSESVAVRSGETVGPWRVLVDSNYSVKLKGDAEEFELHMFAQP